MRDILVSKQLIDSQIEGILSVLRIDNRHIDAEGIGGVVNMNSQWSLLRRYTEEVIHVVEALISKLSHILHIELIVIVEEEEVREVHAYLVVNYAVLLFVPN
jgi:hypothetical protein